MSAQQINPSPCLERLSHDGYHVKLSKGSILVTDIPYLKLDGTTGFGSLYAPAPLVAGNTVGAPTSHTLTFIGEHPCDYNGQPNQALVIGVQTVNVNGVNVSGHQMSQKPQATGRYRDWQHQFSVYAKIIAGPAMKLDPTLVPNPGRVPLSNPSEDVFAYPNNASSRNGTAHLEAKYSQMRVGIIGLGGTGAHVADNLSKTRVAGIELFDDDILETHNAFRGPGAVSIETLKSSPFKVDYYKEIYGQMRHDIVAHTVRVTSENLHLLDDLDFVFLCVDVTPAKAEIVEGLRKRGIPFVDTGMGASLGPNGLTGMVRSTLVTPDDAASALRSVALGSSHDNLYETNIQIAELNSLNACLAMLQFKIHFGFYQARPGSKPSWHMPIGRDHPTNMGAPSQAKTPANISEERDNHDHAA